MHCSINYHHYNNNRSGDLLYHPSSDSSDTNTKICCICAPSTAEILFHSNLESESSSSTTTTNESPSEIVERPLERYIMSPDIELEAGSNGDNDTNHREMRENISSSNRWCTNSNNNNIFSRIINKSIMEKSKHEMRRFINTTSHEPEVNALSSSSTSLLRENDEMKYLYENRPNNTEDINNNYDDSIIKNIPHNSAINLHQNMNFTNYCKIKQLEKYRESMPKEHKNENVSKMCSVNKMHTSKNNKWCYKDELSLSSERANATPSVVHANMYFEPVHSEHKLSVIIPTRLRVPSLWFTNTTQNLNSNSTTFVKLKDKKNEWSFHNFQTSLPQPMPSAKTKVQECGESYREHMHSLEVCDKQEACSKHINHINSTSSSNINSCSCSCNCSSKKRRSNSGRWSVFTTQFDKEKAFDQLVVSECNECDDEQHTHLVDNSDININADQSSKRNEERYEREEERNEQKQRKHKHGNAYHNVRKNKIDKSKNEEKTLQEKSSNLERTENEERTTTQNNSNWKNMHYTPKSRKYKLENENNNKNLEKSIVNHYSSNVNAITSESDNNKIIDVKNKMHWQLPHELRKNEREIRRDKSTNNTNSISVSNTTLHQNDNRPDRHRLEISKSIASASVHNLPATLALPYSTNSLEQKHFSMPLHESNLTTLHSLPSAQTTLNTRASARILASGDWFYKWSRDGSHVSPRWVWVDTRSHLLAWAHRETTSNMFSHSIPLEMIWQVTPRELVQPLWCGHEHRIYYVLQIQSTQRILQIATQQKEKVDLWYEALVNVLSFVRRHDVNKLTSIPDEIHDVRISKFYQQYNLN